MLSNTSAVTLARRSGSQADAGWHWRLAGDRGEEEASARAQEVLGHEWGEEAQMREFARRAAGLAIALGVLSWTSADVERSLNASSLPAPAEHGAAATELKRALDSAALQRRLARHADAPKDA